jgi:hypothetical protein
MTVSFFSLCLTRRENENGVFGLVVCCFRLLRNCQSKIHPVFATKMRVPLVLARPSWTRHSFGCFVRGRRSSQGFGVEGLCRRSVVASPGT